MKNEKYSVVFSSLTGNTRMLADAVRDAVGDENCEYFGTDKSRAAKSDMIYVGFWTIRAVPTRIQSSFLNP